MVSLRTNHLCALYEDIVVGAANDLLPVCEYVYGSASLTERVLAFGVWSRFFLELVGELGSRGLLIVEAGRYDDLMRKAEQAFNVPSRWPRDPIPKVLRSQIIEDEKQSCAYCAGKGTATHGPDQRPWHVDHIVPVVAGGRNDRSNLTLACATCNMRKHAKSLEEWKPDAAPTEP